MAKKESITLRKEDYKRYKNCFKIAFALASNQNLNLVKQWINEEKISIHKLDLKDSKKGSKLDLEEFEAEEENETLDDAHFIDFCETLWIDEQKKYQKDLKDEVLDLKLSDQIPFYPGSTIADGLEVGKMAQQYFMRDYNCFNLDNYARKIAFAKTSEILENNEYEVLFEPSFSFNNCVTKCDILIKLPNNTYHVIEVKASTGKKRNSKTKEFENKNPKTEHCYDIAYQYYVLSNCGLNISKLSLMYLNSEYLREGDVDYDELFMFQSFYNEKKDITLLDYAKALNNEISLKIDKIDSFIFDDLERIKLLMSKKKSEILDIFTSPYCYNFKPSVPNKYYGYCQHVTRKLAPHHSVYELSKSGRYFLIPLLLYEEGYENIADIKLPVEFRKEENRKQPSGLNKAQLRQINVIQNKESTIDQEALPKLLDIFKPYEKYPIYMYDFETMLSAVPRFDYARPYQQIPFQYSVHIINNDKYDYRNENTLDHFAYLSDGNEDPRLELISNLVRDLFVYDNGVYVAYYKSFEISRIKEMIEYLNTLISKEKSKKTNKKYLTYIEKLTHICENTIDLRDFFNDFMIYLPQFYGSSSIKNVQPAFDSNFTYNDLKIRKGDMASETFRRRVENNISLEIWLKYFREPMLHYCNRDTLAMIVILQHIAYLLGKRKEL